jgi:hypothetical protein
LIVKDFWGKQEKFSLVKKRGKRGCSIVIAQKLSFYNQPLVNGENAV